MISYSISNMLIGIKNAFIAKHSYVDVFYSKMKLEMVQILKNEGFVYGFKTVVKKSGFSSIRIILKYTKNKKSVITGVSQISKSGCRVYKKAKEIPRIFNGLGLVIVSTSCGVVTGKKAQMDLNLGGEILCYIW